MPVGKNALKRVSNNGYSKVNTAAPDMEHSEVVEPEVKLTEKKPVAKKPTVTKPAPKTAPKAKTANKTEKPKEKDTRPDGFVRIELGGDMPIHLL